ncbi:MAG: NnrS family protein [Methylococcaceae bacterium]|nr:NnrS family protein [Methylococcaceae bacterium]
MKQKLFDYPLFALGFRPFFILAGLSALFLMLLWNAILHGKITAHPYYPGAYWHAHEMLIGYSAAVIAGFLLTAVKNWTGLETVTGGKLAGLCLLWLYGRIVPFYADTLPGWLCALIDWAFLPVLAYQLSIVIIAVKQPRNLIFIGLLAMMALGNALMHADLLGFTSKTADNGLQLIIATIIFLILVIAGRVFPFFTERGLQGFIAIRNQQIDGLAIAAALSVFCLQLIDVSGTWLALAAIAAAVLNGLRMSGWYTQRIWYVPLLWILYTGYAWIIIGFVLTALAAYNLVAGDLALHAFTLGGIGVLTLGMMARVALGHTGRALKASNTIAIAFVLLNLAAAARVLLPAAIQSSSALFIYAATLLWLGAFALFLAVYLPVLTQPRIAENNGSS